MTGTVIILFMFLSFVTAAKWAAWKNHAEVVELKLANLTQTKKKQKQKQQEVVFPVDLELATTSQIFQELSKRGRVILLLPHRNREGVYVETLAARLSPSQTMGVLKVAYSGIAGNMDEEEDDD